MTELEIPEYQIVARRADHRLGATYEGIWQPEQRDIELLLLHTSLRQIEDFEQRFLDAARQATRLDKQIRGIVMPLDAGSHGQRLYVARDQSAGEGLDAYLARLQKRGAQVPLDTLRKTLLAIALRLRALHKHRIVHGNLTAAALKATRDAGLLLTDLGLPLLNAQEATRLPHGASQVLPFLSPEQMLERGVGASTDIFAFGVVAYYLATGHLPRAASRWEEGLRAYWAHTPDLVHDRRPDVEPQLSAIIHKALSIQPQNRFGNVGELVDALQRVILASSGTRGGTDTTRVREDVAHAIEGAEGASAAAMSISVHPDNLLVGPGDEGMLHLTIMNQSARSAGYTVTVHGVPRQWVSIPQETVRLGPGAVAEITMRVAVPAESSAESGDHPLRIEVATTGDASQAKAIETSLTILPFRELIVEMEPESIRQGQSVTLTLRNSGNEQLKLAVRGDDPNELLRFEGGTEELTLPPGASTTVPLRVSAREQPLLGRVQNLPFSVAVTAQDSLSEHRDGRVTIAPVVPAWLTAIMLLILLGLCIVAGAWLWPRFAGELPGVAQAPTETPVTVTPGATATTMVAVTATEAVDAALLTVQSAGASETETPTATPTATPTVAEPDETLTPTATATVAEESVPTGTPSPEASATETEPTATATTTAVVPATPEQTAVADNEVALHVQVGERDEIWVVSRQSGEARRLLSNARQPVWSPDGQHIAFTRPLEDEDPQAETLFVAGASGTELSALTEDPMQIGGLTWSPDGSQIAYHAASPETSGTSEYQVFIAQSDGSGVRQLTTDVDGYVNMWPLWSPVDAELLAYAAPQFGNGAAQLRLYNTQNQNMTVLFTEDEVQLSGGEYDWSPDGQQVVFSLGSDGDATQLFVLNVSIPLATRLTADQVQASLPKWSPDGERIAFVMSNGENGEDQEAAAIVGASGEAEQSVFGAASIEALFWSPAGEELAVVGEFDGQIELWVLEISGSEAVALIENLAELPFSGSGETTPAFLSAAWRPRAP
ncbi:MAG: FixG Ig-like domain-containing protein [Chloroflexota bacterium]